ncbi:secretion system component EssB-YukC-like protein [Streptococcus sp. ZB199]|nr:secretion system component EssB-YukC-like protein [Streptococcus sp. ZB199]
MKEEQFTLEEQVFRFEKKKRAGGWTSSVQKWIARIYAIYGFWISIIPCF